MLLKLKQEMSYKPEMPFLSSSYLRRWVRWKQIQYSFYRKTLNGAVVIINLLIWYFKRSTFMQRKQLNQNKMNWCFLQYGTTEVIRIQKIIGMNLKVNSYIHCTIYMSSVSKLALLCERLHCPLSIFHISNLYFPVFKVSWCSPILSAQKEWRKYWKITGGLCQVIVYLSLSDTFRLSSLLVVPKVRIEIALQDRTQVQPDIIIACGICWVSDSIEGFQELCSKPMGNIYFRAIVMAHFSLVSESRRPTYDLSTHPRDTISFGHYYSSSCACVN